MMFSLFDIITWKNYLVGRKVLKDLRPLTIILMSLDCLIVVLILLCIPLLTSLKAILVICSVITLYCCLTLYVNLIADFPKYLVWVKKYLDIKVKYLDEKDF